MNEFIGCSFLVIGTRLQMTNSVPLSLALLQRHHMQLSYQIDEAPQLQQMGARGRHRQDTKISFPWLPSSFLLRRLSNLNTISKTVKDVHSDLSNFKVSRGVSSR